MRGAVGRRGEVEDPQVGTGRSWMGGTSVNWRIGERTVARPRGDGMWVADSVVLGITRPWCGNAGESAPIGSGLNGRGGSPAGGMMVRGRRPVAGQGFVPAGVQGVSRAGSPKRCIGSR